MPPLTTDTRVIAHDGDLLVLAQRLEVMFCDGTSVHLHPVAHCPAGAAQRGALPDVFLRALQLEGLRWLVVDLRDLAPPTLAEDLRRATARDAHRLMMNALRGQYATAALFATRAHWRARARWWHLDTQPLADAA